MALLEGFGFNILCITDVCGRTGRFFSVRVSGVCSFLGLPLMPQLSLLVRSWPLKILKLETELLRRFESRNVVDFNEGLGLGTAWELIFPVVAEAGSLGGGMLSCFGMSGAYSDALSFAARETAALILDFDVLRFQPRLSFRRSEEVDDGVVGSSGLETCVGVSVFAVRVNFWARGPVSLGPLCSESW